MTHESSWKCWSFRLFWCSKSWIIYKQNDASKFAVLKLFRKMMTVTKVFVTHLVWNLVPSHPHFIGSVALLLCLWWFLSSKCASVVFLSLCMWKLPVSCSFWLLFSAASPWLSSPLTRHSLPAPAVKWQTSLSRMDWCRLCVSAGLRAAVACAACAQITPPLLLCGCFSVSHHWCRAPGLQIITWENTRREDLTLKM